ncbi:MAG: hypothetical protein VZQ98_18490, partial [Bacteroidales bacterium]|nr:hypothetical protein [Bacteroidales bacterium]
MKKVLIIALLFLTTSAFCDEYGVYLSGGYSQTLTGTTPVGDLSYGWHSQPFENYGMEVGIDIFRFQIGFTDRFQAISDESIFQLPFLVLALPFATSARDSSCTSKCGFTGIERYLRIIEVIGFILHGSLYFPVVPNNYFGFVNKHRLITEMITKGIHKESFTFQDDIGIRLQIHPEGHYGFFI